MKNILLIAIIIILFFPLVAFTTSIDYFSPDAIERMTTIPRLQEELRAERQAEADEKNEMLLQIIKLIGIFGFFWQGVCVTVIAKKANLKWYFLGLLPYLNLYVLLKMVGIPRWIMLVPLLLVATGFSMEHVYSISSISDPFVFLAILITGILTFIAYWKILSFYFPKTIIIISYLLLPHFGQLLILYMITDIAFFKYKGEND